MLRRRLVVLALLAVLVAPAGTPAHAAIPTRARSPARYMLVLGDSLSTGYHAPGGNLTLGDWTCAANTPATIRSGEAGFSCLLWTRIKRLKPHLTIVNLAVDGEDSCSFIHVLTCPYGSSARASGPPYDVGFTPQLKETLAFLHRHPGQVSPITFELGGNDNIVDGLGHVVPDRFQTMEQNRDRILRQIRKAAPRADILLLDYPTPQPRDYAPKGVEAAFGNMIAAEAARYRGFPVDLGHPTEFWDDSFVDSSDHPSDTGQRQLAETVWDAYNAYLHGRRPVIITVQPTDGKGRAGRPIGFQFATGPGAQATLRLTYGANTYTAAGTADAAGHWQGSWNAAAYTGKISVHACASSGGASSCIDEYLSLT